MGLCGTRGCGCGISSSPTNAPTLFGESPDLTVTGAGTGANPWRVGFDESWLTALTTRVGTICRIAGEGNAVASGSTTALTLGTTIYDPAGWKSGSTIVPDVAGYYEVHGWVMSETSLASATRYYIALRKNGLTITDSVPTAVNSGGHWFAHSAGTASNSVVAFDTANGTTDAFSLALQHNEGASEDWTGILTVRLVAESS